MSEIELSAVIAVAKNRTIGRNNALPWRLRSDLQRFKRLTLGHSLIMGRKTFESIGKPLPGRHTIVVSRQLDLQIADVRIANSIDDAVKSAPTGLRAFVVGGAEIYRLVLPRVTNLYVTQVLADIEGDAWLEEWDSAQFECVEQSYTPADSSNDWPTLFQHLIRRPVFTTEVPD
jgi:dihydrofolate reductase